MRELLLLIFLALAASTVADQSPISRGAVEATAVVEEGGNRVTRPKKPTIDEMIYSTPDKMFAGVEEAQRAAMRATPPTGPSVNEMVTKALTGGDGVIQMAPMDERAVNAEAGMEQAAVAAFKEKTQIEEAKRRAEATAGSFGINAPTIALVLVLIGVFIARRRQKRRTDKNETDARS